VIQALERLKVVLGELHQPIGRKRSHISAEKWLDIANSSEIVHRGQCAFQERDCCRNTEAKPRDRIWFYDARLIRIRFGGTSAD